MSAAQRAINELQRLRQSIQTLEEVEREHHKRMRDLLEYACTGKGPCGACNVSVFHVFQRIYTEEGEIHICEEAQGG